MADATRTAEQRLKHVILFTAKTMLLPVMALVVIVAAIGDGLRDMKELLKEWYE
jgi:hypothetical protein